MNLAARVLANVLFFISPRAWISVLTLDGCAALALTVRAFASGVVETSMIPASFAISLVNQLPAIITAVVGLVGAVTGVWTLIRAGQIKRDVNSQFSKSQEETRLARAEVAALKQVIADKPDATSEEKVRAIVAQEQQTRPAPVPTEPPK